MSKRTHLTTHNDMMYMVPRIVLQHCSKAVNSALGSSGNEFLHVFVEV